jgi:hypothetical protein
MSEAVAVRAQNWSPWMPRCRPEGCRALDEKLGNTEWELVGHVRLFTLTEVRVYAPIRE